MAIAKKPDAKKPAKNKKTTSYTRPFCQVQSGLFASKNTFMKGGHNEKSKQRTQDRNRGNAGMPRHVTASISPCKMN